LGGKLPRAHKGSVIRDQDLKSRAKALRESVDGLLPRLSADCPPERFDRLRAELEEVRSARDDADRLERLTRRGEPLARAYAGLLKYYLDPETPVILSFPLPGGAASYANLARTDREAEVAVQQSDEPDRLVIGYVDWSRRGFHFFATRRVLHCTGRSERPPEEFLTEKVAELPYRLTATTARRRYQCAHLEAGEPRPFLEVGWPGAEAVFRVCRRCAKPDRHLLAGLSDGAVVPDPSASFPVAAALNVRCGEGDACVHARLPPLPRGLLRGYEGGKLGDSELLDAYLAELKPRIERPGRVTFVAGGVCYGGRRDAFLAALGPTPTEARALEAVLRDWSDYFEVDEPAASRALEKLWSQHAEEIMVAIVRDPTEAHRLVEEARGAPGRIAEILKRVQRRSDEQELLDALPRYARLTPEAAWADRIARTYRTQREAAAERTILQTLPREGKERGIAFGFLAALGRGGAHSWQFTPTEQEFGQTLAARARDLLTAPADGYHAALDRLLSAAGVVDWGEPAPGAGTAVQGKS
jgi:hypothetical protein